MQPTNRLALVVSLAVLIFLAGCGGPATGTSNTAVGTPAADPVKLSLVAYSTPREAYEAIIPAFQQTGPGKRVSVQISYGASGDQSHAVVAGLPADIVAFSLEPDITRLVQVGLVDANWNQDPYHGVVTDSVVVLAVRPGNPKQIQSWDDLIKPGVEVITPNPFTSGGARWNVMAAYGAQLEQGKSPEQGTAYLRTLFSHVSVQDKSARESLQTFMGGKGDVMIAYENEVIAAQQAGQKLDYVIPDQTIRIENPVAVTRGSQHPEQAHAFVNFLHSPQAQHLFGTKGYRPVVPQVLSEFKYVTPPHLFTIAKLGGWSAVNTKFFDSDSSIMATIEQGQGASHAAH
jgi:sulfate transport system substrate-binding protein